MSTNAGHADNGHNVPESKDPYSRPAAYWDRTGQTSHTDFVTGEALDQGHGVNDPIYGSSPAHFRQEAALVEMLDKLWTTHPKKRPKSIFEAGCGRGRLAHLFKRILPTAWYAAIDVGEAQLAEARQLRPEAHYWLGDLTDPNLPSMQRNRDTHWVDYPNGYDLVVCAEVLMHIRPVDLLTAFDNLVTLTREGGTIITIDWVPNVVSASTRPKPKAAFWNFAHDYGRLFQQDHRQELYPTAGDVKLIDSRRTDNQMIFILEKVA